MDEKFALLAPFKPAGSQPDAIDALSRDIAKGKKFQTLLGVTGSGKTFTMANVIQRAQKPALVIVHNKTLAAQLYWEFRDFFPQNRVEYFVSYYDYYQPESYIPQRDLYIEKDAQVNPRLEQMRLSATASLSSRSDTIVVASVSCIYALGNPANFRGIGTEISKGQKIKRKELLGKLISLQFERNDTELLPGRFRAHGDTIDIIPGYSNDMTRLSLFGDEVEEITIVDKNTGEVIDKPEYFFFYPARHFVTSEEDTKIALESIRRELDTELASGRLGPLEAHRLKQRTLYDLEMITETGFCKGIENYSRHFDKRKAGERPYCLLDYFPKDFLLFIDESHQTIPQLHGMYHGDRARKKSLIDYGFRLTSAFDNRPLKFEEFSEYMRQVVFVSATPSDYELSLSKGKAVEQIIRPTGLVDPEIEVRKTKGQAEDLIGEIRKTVGKGNRALVTTLTKKLAEEFTEFWRARG